MIIIISKGDNYYVKKYPVATREAITQPLVWLPVKYHLQLSLWSRFDRSMQCFLRLRLSRWFCERGVVNNWKSTCWPLTYSMVSLWSSPATVSHCRPPPRSNTLNCLMKQRFLLLDFMAGLLWKMIHSEGITQKTLSPPSTGAPGQPRQELTLNEMDLSAPSWSLDQHLSHFFFS